MAFYYEKDVRLNKHIEQVTSELKDLKEEMQEMLTTSELKELKENSSESGDTDISSVYFRNVISGINHLLDLM